MSSRDTHQITTNDGATIVGAVHGQGPPLVFTPGGIGDAELDWQGVIPHLADRFTCYLPSLPGRGLSSEHADLGPGRLVDGLTAYVDSIGEPVGLVGWSAGGMVLSVGAASDEVVAMAAVEPTMFHLMDDGERAGLAGVVGRLRELAANGDLSGAVRAFLSVPFSEDELAAADKVGYFDATGPYVPTLLQQMAQTMNVEGPGPDDPAVLQRISAKTMVLYGSDTKPFLEAGAKYVADHITDVTLVELPGMGHAAPLTDPATVARVLGDLFSSTHERA